MIRGKALNRKLSLFFGILSVLLWCNTTYATILKPLNMAKLVEKSSLIVQGQVSDIRGAWNGNQTMILTEIDITLAQANAVLKGEQVNNTITLKLWGGTVSDRTTIVLGNPSFSMNENVLLFLRPGRRGDFNGFFRLVGMAQGKYRVENGVAKRDLRNIAFVGANRPETLEEQSLANLRADIAQEVLRQDNQRQDQR